MVRQVGLGPVARAGELRPARRRYDGTLRRLRAAGTRERILAAGTDILRGAPIRDWAALTISAVADRAGVNQRTVYRHFVNERALRDAVMRRLEEKEGIELDALRLDDVAGIATRIFEHVAAYPPAPRPQLDPTLTAAGQRQRDALLAAVEADAPGWLEADRVLAASILDVLWSLAAYERLVVDWHLDRRQAIRGVTWAIGLVRQALRTGSHPPAPASGRRARPRRAAGPAGHPRGSRAPR